MGAAQILRLSKANKQDGGHCWQCLRHAYNLAIKLDAYKDAIEFGHDLLPLAETDADRSSVHFRLAMALQEQGIKDKKDASMQESNAEFKSAVDLDPSFARARYHLGDHPRPPASGRRGARAIHRIPRSRPQESQLA
jgi:hypothetical protein